MFLHKNTRSAGPFELILASAVGGVFRAKFASFLLQKKNAARFDKEAKMVRIMNMQEHLSLMVKN